MKFYDNNVENIFLSFYLFLYPVISVNDLEPMSDEDDDQMDESEAEKEAQYGFELENGTFLVKFLDIVRMHLFQKRDPFLNLILNLKFSIVCLSILEVKSWKYVIFRDF